MSRRIRAARPRLGRADSAPWPAARACYNAARSSRTTRCCGVRAAEDPPTAMASEPIERRARTGRNGSGPAVLSLVPAAADGRAGEGRAEDSAANGTGPASKAGAADGDAAVQLAARELGAASQTTGLALAALVEAILFVADRPVAVTELAKVLEVPRPMVERALGDLASATAERGVRLMRRNGTVQMVSSPAAAPIVQRFLGLAQDGRLSRPALETLSIIAYRQPLTRPEIEQLRGVSCEAVLRTLLSRELIEPLGRRATVGNPVEYGTTLHFLAYFGLTSVADLPLLEGLAVDGGPDGAALGGAAPAVQL